MDIFLSIMATAIGVLAANVVYLRRLTSRFNRELEAQIRVNDEMARVIGAIMEHLNKRAELDEARK